MKKLISMLAVLTLILGVCVCASAEDKTYTVGILQLIQHPALDLATQGFKDALTEKLGGTVVFDEGNASCSPVPLPPPTSRCSGRPLPIMNLPWKLN